MMNIEVVLLIVMPIIAAVFFVWSLLRLAKVEQTVVALAVVALGSLTGMLHLWLGIAGDWLLFANGFGFFALLTAIYFPIAELAPYRQTLRLGLGVYTLVTIGGYFLLHLGGPFDVVGLGSKAIELLLLVILAVDWIQQRDGATIKQVSA